MLDNRDFSLMSTESTATSEAGNARRVIITAIEKGIAIIRKIMCSLHSPDSISGIIHVF